MQDSPSGVPGDVARDGAVALSRADVVDRSFHGRERSIPHPFSAINTPVQVYVSDGGAYQVAFGRPTAFSLEIWTDEKGVGEIIGALQAALVRAQIAGIGQYKPHWIEAPEAPEDVPF